MRGPAVGALDTTFRERWDDPTPLDPENPLAYLRDQLRGADLRPDPLPPLPADPPPVRSAPVQVLRTYPGAPPGYRSRRTASAASPAATSRRYAGPAG